jgi:hypothetical protein
MSLLVTWHRSHHQYECSCCIPSCLFVSIVSVTTQHAANWWDERKDDNKTTSIVCSRIVSWLSTHNTRENRSNMSKYYLDKVSSIVRLLMNDFCSMFVTTSIIYHVLWSNKSNGEQATFICSAHEWFSSLLFISGVRRCLEYEDLDVHRIHLTSPTCR